MAVTFVKWLHLTILIFVFAGAFLPQKFLLGYLIFLPLVVVQWWLNRGTCILTNLENWLEGNQKRRSDQQGQFIKTILGKFFDPLPEDKTIKLGLYVILISMWLIAWIRFL